MSEKNTEMNMEQVIAVMEDDLVKLKKAYKQEQADAYKNKEHKQFTVGDWVTDGCRIGVVGWVENKACDCPESDGLMGIDLKNDSFGFIGFAKRDNWDLLSKEQLNIYTKERVIELKITGEEMKVLAYLLGYRNVNPYKIRTKLLDLLDTTFPELSRTSKEQP